MNKATLTQIVDSAGASVTLDPTLLPIPEVVNLIPEGGAPITLAGNWSIAFSDNPNLGNATTFTWKGGDIALADNLGSHTLFICGLSVSQEMLDSDGQITVYSTDTTGTLLYIYSPSLRPGIQSISGDTIIQDTLPLDRLAGMTAGQILQADSGNTPRAVTITGDITLDSSGVSAIGSKKVVESMFQDSTPAYILLVNGSNRPTFQPITGAIQISSSGNAIIPDGTITTQMLSFTAGLYSVAQLTLSKADIWALNTSPKQIIAAPGVGNSIVVSRVITSQTYVSTPYDTNTDLAIYTDTANTPQALTSNILNFSATRTVSIDLISPASASDTQIIENKPLMVYVPVGNPANGDGTVTITVYYTVLNGGLE